MGRYEDLQNKRVKKKVSKKRGNIFGRILNFTTWFIVIVMVGLVSYNVWISGA